MRTKYIEGDFFMYYLVYKITNKINGMYYIGAHQTNDKQDDYMGSGTRIKNAIKKYGKQNFEKEILIEVKTIEEMYLKEKEFISINSQSYNIHPGGRGGFNFINENGFKGRGFSGKKHTNETKNKIAEKKKGNTAWLGKKHTNETKNKMKLQRKEFQKGENNSQFGTMWITNGNFNKKIKKNDLIPEGWKKGRMASW
jgi:group I intron endonuclease